MSSDLREQLQASLAGSYTVERELGGGGMSRVFVATETRLKRQVVVKVLHPDLAAGVNVERFEREIALAAALQHPCIVPVHTAGVVDGLPYYTMPFIQGESLRARLAAVGMLPVNEAVKVLRDTAGALAYAHERGIVHRDIKPDNVLLSGGYAVVTDFGIAKALSASKTVAPGGTITQLGTSVGTPAYMAPEQAAGDPNVDHRADIYSFGCMAYELLAGRTPFHGKTSHKLLAAQMSEAPPPILEQRPELPPALATLVMQCLEKDEAKRPRSANAALQVLDAIGTPSGGGHDVRTAIARSTKHSLVRALAIWLVATAAVATVAKAAVIAIGLPLWTFPGAMLVMGLGFPAILFTSFAKHGAHVARTMAGVTPGGSAPAQSTITRLAVRASPFLSWKRTWMGGAIAVGAFTLLVAGYMVLRLLGVGAVGSLFAKGALHVRDKVVLADFRSRGGDSTLGLALTEALRTDLSQSPAIVLVQPSQVRGALNRMGRPTEGTLTESVAREVAMREGAKAVIDGDVTPVGTGYLLTVRLIVPQSGDALVSMSETPERPSEVVAAVGRLSRALRAKIGESLKSVQAAPPLDRVTTSSLEALQQYTQGSHRYLEENDPAGAATQLRAATALDSNFAMAYRRLSLALAALGGYEPEAAAAMQRAYDLRDRVPEIERHLIAGSYWSSWAYDRGTAIAEFERALLLDPDNAVALGSVGNLYIDGADMRRAEVVFRRLTVVDPTYSLGFGGLLYVQVANGDTAGVFATLRALERQKPGSNDLCNARFLANSSFGQFDSAETAIEILSAKRKQDLVAANLADGYATLLASVRGRMRAARSLEERAAISDSTLGNRSARMDLTILEAAQLTAVLHRRVDAVRLLDSAAEKYHWATLPPLGQRLGLRAIEYGRASDATKAAAFAMEMSRRIPVGLRGRPADALLVWAWVRFAERKWAAAIELFRGYNEGLGGRAGLAELGNAYDAAMMTDSAMVVYERWLNTPDYYRVFENALWLGPVLRRLGELHDARGESERALSYYSKFVTLWEHADPELQPEVSRARKRIAQLSARKG